MVTMYILKFKAVSGWWLCTSWGLRWLLDGDYVHHEVYGSFWMVTMYIVRFTAASGWWLYTSWGLRRPLHGDYVHLEV